MALAVTAEEYAQRRERVGQALVAAGLDGLLCFHQESMYWLCGYETFGYCFFQCLVLTADGRMTLLTRAPDRLQARHTSDLEDVRIWADGAVAEPADQLVDVLAERGLRAARIGVEYDAAGLTGRHALRLERALAGCAQTVDASDLVARLRLIKSPTELAYIRRAAGLADDALDAALRRIAPRAWEGDVLADMQAAVLRGGGDYPGNPFVVGSGADALLCRDHTGRRRLDSDDQLTLEWAGAYRRYHAAMMRTALLGEVEPEHRSLHAAATDAMAACVETARPGRTCGEVFDAHARVLDEAGLHDYRLNACGYAMGAKFAPSWMDWPMLYAGNPAELAADMAFFIHIIIMNRDTGRAMTLGQTVEITDAGAVSLHRHGSELLAL
jgi:Xaa-Pro dipeptidase